MLLIYKQKAKELNIKGELFFIGIWNFIDEYVHKYYPIQHEDPEIQKKIDEQEFRKKLWSAYNVSKHNQDK